MKRSEDRDFKTERGPRLGLAWVIGARTSSGQPIAVRIAFAVMIFDLDFDQILPTISACKPSPCASTIQRRLQPAHRSESAILSHLFHFLSPQGLKTKDPGARAARVFTATDVHPVLQPQFANLAIQCDRFATD